MKATKTYDDQKLGRQSKDAMTKTSENKAAEHQKNSQSIEKLSRQVLGSPGDRKTAIICKNGKSTLIWANTLGRPPLPSG